MFERFALCDSRRARACLLPCHGRRHLRRMVIRLTNAGRLEFVMIAIGGRSMRRMWFGALAFGLSAMTLSAQEKETEPQETARDERPNIQVLQHPYDLSSFYRAPSGNSMGGWSYGGYADPNGTYGSGYLDDSGLPPLAYRPDLRGRVFGPRWDSAFGSGRYQMNGGWGTRRRFQPRMPVDEPAATPAPARPQQ